MPSTIRWPHPSRGRPLRLGASLGSPRGASRLYYSRAAKAPNKIGRAARTNSHYSHCYYYTYDSSYAAANQIHYSTRSPRNQLGHGLLRPASQTTHQPRQVVSQRRVFQTAPPIPSSAWCLFHPSLQSRSSSVAAADLPQTSALPFSTFSNASNSSSSSAPLSALSPPFSRKHSRHKLALWLPAIMAASQARSHSDDSHAHDDSKPHAHSHAHGLLGHHHHHHDNVYLTSQNKNDAGVRITRVGLFCNLGMAFAKGAGGYVFNSQSMIADAWHSLSDLASDVLTLATVSWSLRPPTDKFPAGFGKVESLGSLGVSGMLLGGGIFMCMSSLQSLHAHFFLDAAAAAEVLAHSHSHGHSHSHSHSPDAPSLHAAWLALGTILVKEWLYRATMKVARERKSSVLASNAVHHRVDSLTGIVTLAAILGANLIRDASWLDPVGGLLISLLVIRAGLENTIAALYELADRSIDDEVKSSVRKHVIRALADDVAVPDGQQHRVELRDVSGVKSGQNYMVDLELAVPQDWTVETVRIVEDAVRKHVGGAVRGVRRVRVRFVALDETVEKFDEFIPGDVSPRSSPEPEDEHDHDHDHDHNHDHEHDHSHENGGKKHKH